MVLKVIAIILKLFLKNNKKPRIFLQEMVFAWAGWITFAEHNRAGLGFIDKSGFCYK